ncbi:MAG: histidine-type phosphatase [Atopobiaceae bacterium]|nr:histidine-type phosphatase [Atopobiaceae bacterium]
MRKKRTTLLVISLLTLLLALGPLVGCGAPQQTTPKNDQAATEEVATTEEAATEEVATTEEGAEEVATTETATEASAAEPATTGTAYADAWKPRDGYTLKQVVAMSRHNLRAPQEKDMETLSRSTTHDWIAWSSNGSELTVKGGVAETIMGEFFRKWLEREQLIPENYIPGEGEVRFYANPRQRTLATTQFFSSGMLPVANVGIEYHGDYDSRDPTFKPRFGFVSDSYIDAATDEIAALGSDAGLAGLDEDLQEDYNLISEVLDYQNSPAYKAGDVADLKTGDATYTIELDEEPAVSGSLKTANQLSDALTLQYYEAEDLADASFGTPLTYEQWQQIAAVKNAFGDRRYNSKLVSVDCAHLLVSEIADELGKDGRRFSFLCGHDSNQSSLLHALGVTDYDLPDTLETKTPIGGKILFEVWESKKGEQLCNIRYVYATTEQVRNLDLLSLENAPASYDLEFEGLERNADGLYSLADVQNLLTDTKAAYDQLAVDYPEEVELDQAA